jgi:hypothetical protein
MKRLSLLMADLALDNASQQLEPDPGLRRNLKTRGQSAQSARSAGRRIQRQDAALKQSKGKVRFEAQTLPIAHRLTRRLGVRLSHGRPRTDVIVID